MIKPDTIQQIFDSSRIEEVVGDFVQLRKRGVNLLGICPFHDEKTPSFTVSPAKGIFKCFGCGKAGNSVGFIMEHEHLSYPEALRYLAKKYGVEIEEKPQTTEEIAKMNARESLLAVTEFAAQYFEKTLHETNEGKSVGLSYFTERGMRLDTIKQFQLGYCTESSDGFTKAAMEQGYKIEFLEKSGLTLVREGRYFDRFRGRVIFPITTQSGRVIGFGGRILRSDNKRAAKYVNSPESDIYNKSRTLYGIWHARNEIVKKDHCYLVEGYTDVISLAQAGITNVVASSGTSLTVDQIRLIKRYTPNITILYDGDPAGIKASFRGIDLILEEGMNVYVVLFPEGEDPDSFSRAHRSDEVETFLTQKSENFIKFKSSILIEETAGDPVKMAGLIQEIVSSIAKIPDSITRTLFVRECSTLMNIDEETLMHELNKKRRDAFKKNHKEVSNRDMEEAIPLPQKKAIQEQVPVDTKKRMAILEANVIRLLVLYGEGNFTEKRKTEDGTVEQISIPVAQFIVNDIMNDETRFRDPIYQDIFDVYRLALQEDKLPTTAQFTTHEDLNIVERVVHLIQENHAISEGWKKKDILVPDEQSLLDKAIPHALFCLKLEILDEELDMTHHSLQELKDDEQIMETLQVVMLLEKERRKVAEKLSRVVLS